MTEEEMRVLSDETRARRMQAYIDHALEKFEQEIDREKELEEQVRALKARVLELEALIKVHQDG
jgi:hypothetical protein